VENRSLMYLVSSVSFFVMEPTAQQLANIINIFARANCMGNNRLFLQVAVGCQQSSDGN